MCCHNIAVLFKLCGQPCIFTVTILVSMQPCIYTVTQQFGYSVFAQADFLHILCFLPISVDLVSWELRLGDVFDIEQFKSCFVALSCDKTAVSQVQTPRDLKHVSGTSYLLYYWCCSCLVMDSKKKRHFIKQVDWFSINSSSNFFSSL